METTPRGSSAVKSSREMRPELKGIGQGGAGPREGWDVFVLNDFKDMFIC